MNQGTLQHAALPNEASGAVRVGVVLSSGGSRGVYAHTGFLLALERMGIDIHASAGAVVGGCGSQRHRPGALGAQCHPRCAQRVLDAGFTATLVHPCTAINP